MIALIAAFVFADTPLQAGDRWTTERTIHIVQEPDKVDTQTVQKIQYSVTRADQQQTTIHEVFSPLDKPDQTTSVDYSFRPSGVLLGIEDGTDPLRALINRIVWTSLEVRQAISWSRKWPDAVGAPGADVSVKPTGRTPNDVTMSVTYKEAGKTRAAATVKIFTKAPVVEDLAMSLNDYQIPGHAKPGSVIISEKLKELHLNPR